MVIFFCVIGFLFLCLCSWRMQQKKPDTYGSAHWCDQWLLFKKGFFSPGGIMVGDWTGHLPVYYDRTHAITFGASGSGKGVSAILPNLLSYDWIFLLDPGGENSAVAARRWRGAGFEFRCINFFSQHTEKPWALPAHGFNPLDLLDPAAPTFAADALVLADMLIRRSGDEKGSAEFFKNTARDHVRDLIVHCKTSEPTARQNLATVFHYMNSDADEWSALLAAMKSNPVGGGLVRTGAIALERREAQAPEEFSAVLSTMQESFNWLTDPQVREFISRSDVDFNILKGHKKSQRGGIVSVVLPLQYNKSHAALSRLALACAVLTMQRAPLAKSKVLFLIDEAADLGKITHLPDWLATLRKYRVVLWPIFQTIGQVVELYGRGWQAVIGNCGLLQILGIGTDLETAEHTEKLLGKCTVRTASFNADGKRSVSQAARSLVTADELRRLEDDCQIAIIGNLPPIALHKTPYWERGEFAGRFNSNPYYDGKTGYQANFKAFSGWLYYVAMWWMAPHPVAACLYVFAPLTFLLLAHAGAGGR